MKGRERGCLTRGWARVFLALFILHSGLGGETRRGERFKGVSGLTACHSLLSAIRSFTIIHSALIVFVFYCCPRHQ